jgi:hypothetical protein
MLRFRRVKEMGSSRQNKLSAIILYMTSLVVFQREFCASSIEEVVPVYLLLIDKHPRLVWGQD